ncbi:MAG: hypothetical protein ACPL1F_02870, partial [bacterium]
MFNRKIGIKSKQEIMEAFKTGVGIEELINLALTRLTGKPKENLEKQVNFLENAMNKVNIAENRIQNVLKQVQVQKGLSFSEKDLQELDRVLQHLTWKTFQVSWGFIYINLTLEKIITSTERFLTHIIQVSRELQLIQIRLQGLNKDTSSFASYSREELEKLIVISAKTPYTLREIAESWTQFKALGIKDFDLFQKTIDTAVSFGLEVSRIADDVARAVEGDATAFKNLRHSIGLTNVVLKEYGGSVDSSGRLSNKNFQDIRRNAEALQKYLAKYLGASEKSISSLSQAISNLEDIFNIFYAKTAENLSGLGDILGKLTTEILNFYTSQTGVVNELSKSFGTFIFLLFSLSPAIKGLAASFWMFNNIVFMFMTGISNLGLTLTTLPKFLNNTQKAVKELSLAMGVGISEAQSMINMYRSLHKTIASGSFEIFQVFMNNLITFSLNFINFFVSFVKEKYLILINLGLIATLGVFYRTFQITLERRQRELDKIFNLKTDNYQRRFKRLKLDITLSEETYKYYEILKKVDEESKNLAENFNISQEKAEKYSREILGLTTGFEDLYRYYLQLKYLSPLKFTIDISDFQKELEDYKQYIITLQETPNYLFQFTLLNIIMKFTLYNKIFIEIIDKLTSIQTMIIKKLFGKKDFLDILGLDFRQFRAYKGKGKLLLEVLSEGRIKEAFTSLPFETEVLKSKISIFFETVRKIFEKYLDKYIEKTKSDLTTILTKQGFKEEAITNILQTKDINVLKKEIESIGRLPKDIYRKITKDLRSLKFYEDTIKNNLPKIDDLIFLSKTFLGFYKKITPETPEDLIYKAEDLLRKYTYNKNMFRKNIKNLIKSLRKLPDEVEEEYYKFLDLFEKNNIEAVNKYIQDLFTKIHPDKKFEEAFKINFSDEIYNKLTPQFIENLEKFLKGDILKRLLIITKEGPKFEKDFNKVFTEFIKQQGIEDQELIKKISKELMSQVLKTPVIEFYNTLSEQFTFLDEKLKETIIEVAKSSGISNKEIEILKRKLERGMISVNKNILGYIIKNLKYLETYADEIKKISDIMDKKITQEGIKELQRSLPNIIYYPFESRDYIKLSKKTIFLKTSKEISDRITENISKISKDIIDIIPKTPKNIIDITQETPKKTILNFFKAFSGLNKNVKKLIEVLQNFTDLLEKVGLSKEAQQNIINAIRTFKSPLKKVNEVLPQVYKGIYFETDDTVKLISRFAATEGIRRTLPQRALKSLQNIITKYDEGVENIFKKNTENIIKQLERFLITKILIKPTGFISSLTSSSLKAANIIISVFLDVIYSTIITIISISSEDIRERTGRDVNIFKFWGYVFW